MEVFRQPTQVFLKEESLRVSFCVLVHPLHCCSLFLRKKEKLSETVIVIFLQNMLCTWFWYF